jgi:serine/threonine protein kinase
MPESIGKYELRRELGRGTTGVVHHALDTFTQREVALKVIDTAAFRDPVQGRFYKSEFLNEASLVGKLDHPHIVSMLDAVVGDDSSFIAMEYVPGGNLAQYTKGQTLLPVASTIEIVFKCCGALDYAFRNGIIHRDIKPANILVVQDTDVKVADFGAALLLRDSDIKNVRGLGSPAYMSPEQTRGEVPGQKSDMYALGVVLYELLTGKRPFEGKSLAEVMSRILNCEPEPVCKLRPDAPETLEAVLTRALAKNPEARFPTWADFALELAKIGKLSVYQKTIPDSTKFTYLKSMDMLRKLTDAEIWELVRISQWARLPARKVIVREDEPGLGFFLLVQGEVKITKRGRLLNVLRNGECFGEMSYIKGRDTPRQATVESLTEVVVAGFDSRLEDKLSNTCQLHLARALLNSLVDRLAMADARIAT